jgi:hypothetical protein
MERAIFPHKFCHLDHGENIPHDYGNLFYKQPWGNSKRLLIGPSNNHIDVVTELAEELTGHPWFVLYILLVPRRGNRSGFLARMRIHMLPNMIWKKNG